jgi:serine/threonine-protein kinase HipA
VSLLSVWIEGFDRPIGELQSTLQGRLGFTYAPDWVMHPSGHAISLSLPLTQVPHLGTGTHAFFNNLLQENDQLQQVLRREGLERYDLVGILTHIGADCAGAISCLPIGAPPVKQPGNLNTDYDILDEQSLEDIVARLAAGQPLPPGMRDPSPVAGYRRKISLTLLPDGQFALPKTNLGVPTTHILKIPDPGHRNEAPQEAMAAVLARNCGLDAAHSRATVIGGQQAMIIERFDRTISDDGIVRRIHQEDFAQAIGLPDDLKYERRATGVDRFDATAIAAILNRLGSPAAARAAFLEITLFNLMIGNTDNHAKNHALLYTASGQPQLAPLYDMVPIPLGGGYTDEFAFHVGKAKRATELTQEDLVAFCIAIGYDARRAEIVLKASTAKIGGRLEAASVSLPHEMRLFDMLIGRELNRLNDLLGLGLALRERDYLPEADARGGWALS